MSMILLLAAQDAASALLLRGRPAGSPFRSRAPGGAAGASLLSQKERARRPLDHQVFDRGGDDEMMTNPYTGDSAHLEFRFADDMNPVAPMDRIATSKGVSSLSGGFKSAQYIPPYVYPDPFPAHKKGTIAGHDKTYWAGNYWTPEMASTGGIAAPEDKLPPKNYPLQAQEDWVKYIPPQAREDRIPSRIARYIDQVADRSDDGDREDCKAGDTVQGEFGNIGVPAAKLVGAAAGNAQAAVIEFADEKGSEDCVPAGCTVMNPCLNAEKGMCTGWTTESSYDPGPEETLRQKPACPAGYKPCKTYKMMVSSAALSKDGKECNLVVPMTTAAPPAAPTTPPDEVLPEPKLD